MAGKNISLVNVARNNCAVCAHEFVLATQQRRELGTQPGEHTVDFVRGYFMANYAIVTAANNSQNCNEDDFTIDPLNSTISNEEVDQLMHSYNTIAAAIANS